MLSLLKQNDIKLICLAGFLKILSKNFIKNFNGKIINTVFELITITAWKE